MFSSMKLLIRPVGVSLAGIAAVGRCSAACRCDDWQDQAAELVRFRQAEIVRDLAVGRVPRRPCYRAGSDGRLR